MIIKEKKGDVLSRARRSLRGHWGKSLCVTGLYGLIYLAALVVLGSLLVVLGQENLFKGEYGQQIASPLISFLVIPFEYGMASYFLDVSRGDRPLRVGTLFSGFQGFKRIFCTLFIRSLYVLAGTLLCIMPGVVLAYRYAMTKYVLRDNPELEQGEALKRSADMMKGNKSELWLWDFALGAVCAIACVVIGLAFASLVWSGVCAGEGAKSLCGIGFCLCAAMGFWAYAVIKEALYAEFYEVVKEEFEAKLQSSGAESTGNPVPESAPSLPAEDVPEARPADVSRAAGEEPAS